MSEVLNFDEMRNFMMKNITESLSKKKEKEEKFYPRLERIERKLDAIINWINWNVKEGMVIGTGVSGKRYVFFERVPTIDLDECEKPSED